MKKLLFSLLSALLLVSCNTTEEIVAQPSPDGIEVDHGVVLAQVTFVDEDSVTFTTDLQYGSRESENTYDFADDVLIQLREEGGMKQISREHAPLIMTSSNSADYYFYLTLTDDEVLVMAQARAPEDFYIADLSKNEAGDYTIAESFVYWFSEMDGSCRNSASAEEDAFIPKCNPNGFLIVEGDVQIIQTDLSPDTIVYTQNLNTLMDWEPSEEDGSFKTTLVELTRAFEQYPEFFEITPFQMTYPLDQTVPTLNELYIP